MHRPTYKLQNIALFLLALQGAFTIARLHARETECQITQHFSSQSAILPDEVTYLGNEGLMVRSGKHKLLFDPFFHNAFGSLQLVPEPIVKAIMAGQSPYDEIEAIFVSHAHEDHFSALDIKNFLHTHAKTKLIAPKQAVDELMKLPDTGGLMSQVIAVDLSYGVAPWQLTMGDLWIEAVRIPHIGWPRSERAKVENLVFRISIGSKITLMHLGDADPNLIHFIPFTAHWQKQLTNTAFPPFWFFLSANGNQILDHQINATQAIGIHVPVDVPTELRSSGKIYFSQPAEHRSLRICP